MGTQNWAEKSEQYAAQGFIPISMAQDFAQIYPDTITKAPEQYKERTPAEQPETEEEETEYKDAA